MVEKPNYISSLLSNVGDIAQNEADALDEVYRRKERHDIFGYAREEHDKSGNEEAVAKLNERIATNIQEWRDSAERVVATLDKAPFMLVEPARMAHYLEQRAQNAEMDIDLAVEDEITRLDKLGWDKNALVEAAKEELSAKEALVDEEKALRGYDVYVDALETVQSLTPHDGTRTKMSAEEIEAYKTAKEQLAQSHAELRTLPGYLSLAEMMAPMYASNSNVPGDKLREWLDEEREEHRVKYDTLTITLPHIRNTYQTAKNLLLAYPTS